MTTHPGRGRRFTISVPLLAAGSLAAATLTACTSSGGAAGAGGSRRATTSPPTTAAAAAPVTGQTFAAGSVAVYPTAGSRLASPKTQISVRGVAPAEIGKLTVTGSLSGPHPGTLRPDSDGNGASFYPAQPFTPGEKVTVSTPLAVAGGQSGGYTFTVSRPSAFTAQPRTEPDDPSQVQSFRSDPTLQPPAYKITHGSISSGDGDVFIGPRSGPGQDGPMIVDAAGDLVWFKSLTGGITPSDFRVQTYQGRPVLTWWQGNVTTTGQGIGADVIYDDSYEQVATVQAGNGYHADLHDFTLTPDNTALVTAYQAVRWDLSSVGGPKDGIALDSIMQEIDVATGNVLQEWHALDHIPVADTYADVSQVGKKGQPDYFDYFHINSVDRSSSGELLISGRATHTIYDVDPTTGDTRWQLGGKHSTFTGDGTDFSSQHDSKWETPDTISLFDNAAGVGKPTSKKSSGMIVRLDTDAHTATLVQRFTSPDVPQAPSQGDTQPLPGGDVFVGWGQEEELSQFAPDGSLVFEAQLPKKDNTYRAFRFPWSGHPLTRPSVSAVGSTVYASWNGATAVATWRVLTGASAAQLKRVATAARDGFETTIPLAKLGAVVEVQALDQAGHVLGGSAPVHTAG